MKERALLLWIGIIFTLLAPVTIGLSFHDKSTAWIAALCGVFVTLIAKFDDLTEIGVGPVRAKMRETIREAVATIAQLRSLASTLGRVASTDLMAGGFMGSMQLKMRLDLYDQLIAQLRELGLDNQQIAKATELSGKAINLIYFREIRVAIEQRKQPYSVEGVPADLRSIGAKFEELLNFENWEAPSPDVIQDFVEANKVATSEVTQWISDYRHFATTGEIRRREAFARNS